MPFAAREAHLYFELGIHPSWQELNKFPNDFVEVLKLYVSVVGIIQNGGQLTF